MVDSPQEEALFGRWLRRRRKALDLTQKALARRAGCSAATIRKLEADERRPSRGVAFALANALAVPEDERAAFVRFARGGWADRPPDAAAVPDLERPWVAAARRAGRHVEAQEGSRASSQRASRADSRSGTAPPAAPRARAALVAREPELRRLGDALREALAGGGRVAFVEGEAGQGKTTLLRAFAERAQAEHGELLVVTGACNAYTGAGDPFLPFREVLLQLTGEVPAGPGLEAFEAERAERLARFAARACATLLERGSQVLGTLLATEPFFERAARAGLALPPRRAAAVTAQGPFQDALSAASHGALSAATTRLLTAVADERPLLLLLDDLQWLDGNSADLLLHLGRVAGGHRVLVLGAYRAADVAAEQNGRRHVMQRVVHELERTYGDAVLDLGSSDGRAFLEAWIDTEPNSLDAEFREALWRQTGGQPLFTIELLRAMQARGDLALDGEGRWRATRTLRWGALPRRVAGALAERVERLGPFERTVLRAAGVEGEVFTAEVVARVLNRDARELSAVLGGELDRRHRLIAGVDVRRVPNGLLSRYRFRHNLIQRFVYEGIDDGQRSYVHEAVADALESLLGDAADPVALAYHYKQAHMPDRAAIHHRKAGDQARKAAALDQAIDHYRAAVESWSGDDPAARAAVVRDLGECQWVRGAQQEARRSLGEALAGFKAAGDERAAGAVQLTIARAFYEEGDWNRALATCREALAMLAEGPETPELAFAQSSLSQLYMTASEADEGLAWGRRALATAERVNAGHVRAHALNNVGTLLCGLGPDRAEEGLRMLSESYALADRLDLSYEACRAAYNHGDGLRQLGRYDEARARWDDMLAYARDHQVGMFEGMGLYDLWRLLWRRGRWSSCFAERPRMRRLADGTGPLEFPLHPVVALLASADVDVGLVARARSALERHESVLERLVEPQFRGPYLRERLRIAITAGQQEAADAFALKVTETLREASYVDTVMPPALTAVQWMAARPWDELRTAAQACLAGLEEAEARYRTSEARAAAAEARGTMATAQGDPGAAAKHLLDAAGHWQACGFPLDEARARGAAARALARSGRDDEAAAERERGRSLLAGLAAQLPEGALQASFATVQRTLLSAANAAPG